MKSINENRPITFIFIGLIILTFTIGTLRTYYSARAGAPGDPRLSADKAATVELSPTFTLFTSFGNSGQTPMASETPTPPPVPTPTPVPTPVLLSADTTGIIVLAIVVVMITLVGAGWGAGNFTRKKPKKK